MISSQYLVGVPMVTAGFLAAMKFVGSLVDPGSGIAVNSLTFVNAPAPAIVQDRMVYAKTALYAGWEAVLAVDGKPICEGAGSWSYPAGHKSPIILIDDWVDDKGCWERLPVGVTIQACAKYKWGDGERTEACTLGFKKEKQDG